MGLVANLHVRLAGASCIIVPGAGAHRFGSVHLV
jgi:hypothetical protein